MLEWLEARCSDTHLQQVFWETHQRLHLLCAACLTGSATICISQQPFHRRCYCLHPAHCSLPPGKQERLCENAVCGLQLRIQYHSACHTVCEAPDSRTKQISVQLDPGLSDRQKSGGQNGQQLLHLRWPSTLVLLRAASSTHSCTPCTHMTVQPHTAPTSSSNSLMTQRW